MTINKKELILQLKDFLGDLDLPDNQEFKNHDPEDFERYLRDALAHEDLGNEIEFKELWDSSSIFWQAEYYSQALQLTIILDYSDPRDCETIDKLADFIIELNRKADDLEFRFTR